MIINVYDEYCDKYTFLPSFYPALNITYHLLEYTPQLLANVTFCYSKQALN